MPFAAIFKNPFNSVKVSGISNFFTDAREFSQPKLIINPPPVSAEVFRNDLLLMGARCGKMFMIC
jgi:hypothetical protein